MDTDSSSIEKGRVREMGFFPEGATFKSGPTDPIANQLLNVIRPLNAASKQAMFAAAQAGSIKRRTWAGCAWNAAGEVVNQSISSASMAERAFGVDAIHVDRFISVWDSIPESVSDARCTKALRQALEHVGVFTEPNMSRTVRIVKGYAYKSLATKFAEQLNSGELTVDMIPGAREMEAVLCGAA